MRLLFLGELARGHMSSSDFANMSRTSQPVAALGQVEFALVEARDSALQVGLHVSLKTLDIEWQY